MLRPRELTAETTTLRLKPMSIRFRKKHTVTAAAAAIGLTVAAMTGWAQYPGQQPVGNQYPVTGFASLEPGGQNNFSAGSQNGFVSAPGSFVAAPNNFATSSPWGSDPHPSDQGQSYRSMSPDSWDSSVATPTNMPVQNSFQPNTFQPNTIQANAFQPTIPAAPRSIEGQVTPGGASNSVSNNTNGNKTIFVSNSESELKSNGNKSTASMPTMGGPQKTDNSSSGFKSASYSQPSATGTTNPASQPGSAQYVQYPQAPITQSFAPAPSVPQNQSWISAQPGPQYQQPIYHDGGATMHGDRYPLDPGPTYYEPEAMITNGSGWGFPETTGFETSPAISQPWQSPESNYHPAPSLPTFNPQPTGFSQADGSFGGGQIFAPEFAGQAFVGTANSAHRRPWPVQRGGANVFDNGQKFDFEEKKKEYPPMSEILATGRYFASAEFMYLKPHFQGNTAISTEGPGFGESIPFSFDREIHPKLRLGFESKYGPGVELAYMNINSNSELSTFTSNGAITGQTSVWMMGRNEWSRIGTLNAGETLTAQHNFEVDSFTFSFFKDLKFPISRLNGNFGFQYANIAHELTANVADASGTIVETLQGTSDMRAFGPRAVMEYYRPIGHTPFELITTFGGSVLFGEQDQFISNSTTGQLNRVSADEFITIAEYSSGVQYKKTIGENRALLARISFANQTWLGGGTAVNPQDSFGLRGLTFMIGYNR